MTHYLVRIPGFRTIWRKFPLGPVPERVRYGIWERPAYAYGVYSAATLAAKLGIPAISVVEFGVAGGRGLLALERIAREIGSATGVRIAVFGFDTGQGLPQPVDYRDLPHVYHWGDYQMDFAKLSARLQSAKLVLGNVAATVPEFLAARDFDPIGFIAFDLDYYSSTMAAFSIFEGAEHTRLPRIYNYFDDVIWPEDACHNDYVGERLAIREFNAAHEDRKICPLPHLDCMLPPAQDWKNEIYVTHDFRHPLYIKDIRNPAHRQIGLD